MKSCHVALIDFYSGGHHAPYLIELVNGLGSFGVKTTVIGTPVLKDLGLPQVVPLKGCEVLGTVYGAARQRVAFPIFRAAIKQAIAAGVTHVHMVYADWHLGAIALAWWRCRPRSELVLTVHGARGVGGGDISIKDRLRRAPQRIALRWLVGRPGAMVMVHHDKTANAVAQIINRKHIAIVPYPVRPAIRIDVECRDSFRKQLGIGKTDKLILCYGATRYDKGADLAVAALARLPERFHLLVAGKQVYFRSDFLGRLAEDNGVADRMHVIPAMLSEADTALALHSCDMMLLPYRSEFPGGQSGPLTQAAAVGATLVAADLPVLTDTIKRYDLGMVFPPGNVEKMAAVLKEAADWRPSPESSDVFVSDHSPQSFARAVYESYLFRRAQAQNF